jgi:hypothetical protein
MMAELAVSAFDRASITSRQAVGVCEVAQGPLFGMFACRFSGLQLSANHECNLQYSSSLEVKPNSAHLSAVHCAIVSLRPAMWLP